MMMLMANSLANISTRLLKMRYVPVFLSDPMRLLIHSAGIKLILVDDSDSNFIEYAKPRPKVKVGVFSSVYNYMGTDTSYRRLRFTIVIQIS